MQVGADIYCDSQLILAEIDRRFPAVPISSGMAWTTNLWADRLFFQLTVAIIFGQLGDRVDPSFVADREKLSGRPFDVKAMAAASGPAQGQWRAQAAWIEEALRKGGTPFLNGDGPGISDLAAHMNIWFLASVFPAQAASLLAGFDALASWRTSLENFGQGRRKEISGSQALQLAVTHEPEVTHFLHDPVGYQGIAPGSPVVVMADDYGRDPISGNLVVVSDQRIVIRRETPDLGALNIHFPGSGFVLRAGS